MVCFSIGLQQQVVKDDFDHFQLFRTEMKRA